MFQTVLPKLGDSQLMSESSVGLMSCLRRHSVLMATSPGERTI